MDYNTKAEEMVTIGADGEDVFVCDFTVDSVEKAETIASLLRAAIADALRAAADEAQLETKRKCAMELRNFFGASSSAASGLAASWDRGAGDPYEVNQDLKTVAFDHNDGDPAPKTNHGSTVYMWAADYAGALAQYAFAKASCSTSKEESAKYQANSARRTLVYAIMSMEQELARIDDRRNVERRELAKRMMVSWWPLADTAPGETIRRHAKLALHCAGDTLKAFDAVEKAETEEDVYMVHVNSGGSVFVKTLWFFREQGGFAEPWGEGWVPIVATSIEDAREKGCLLPGARPYSDQAK